MPCAEVKGYKIHYEEQGRGKPVVFLHCWTGNLTFFKDQMKNLGDRFRCIGIDMRGHGKSDVGGEYTPMAFAEDLETALPQIGIGGEPIIFVGHSMGGMVALQFALKHPELTRALVLVDTSAKITNEIFQNIATFALWPFGFIAPKFAKGAVIRLTAMYPLADPEAVKYVFENCSATSNPVVAQAMRGLRDHDVLDRLGEIKAPALVLVGTWDIFTDLRHAYSLHSGIRNSRLRVIPKAGHMTTLEQPRLVNQHIEEFFTDFGLF